MDGGPFALDLVRAALPATPEAALRPRELHARIEGFLARGTVWKSLSELRRAGEAKSIGPARSRRYFREARR